MDFDYKSLFICSIIACWTLFGFYTPSSVLSSDPIAFIFSTNGPEYILFFTITVFAGIFLFWGSWIYYFSTIKVKKILSVGAFLFFIFSIINLFFIKLPDATLSNTLTYERHFPNFSNYLLTSKLVWLFILFLLFTIGLYLLKNKTKFANTIIILVSISVLFVSGFNFVNIKKATVAYNNKIKKANEEFFENNKYINFSKTKKNVLIIFIDTAISSYLPIAFKEYPKLNEQFRGYTYYPKTLTFYPHTILAYLPILGGYEYTPLRMDERNGLFDEKYMQAITVLPLVFKQNHWATYIVNSKTNAWNLRSDMKKIFGEARKNVFSERDIYNSLKISSRDIPSAIMEPLNKTQNIKTIENTNRNIIYFSILSAAPVKIREYLYDGGNYHNINKKKNLYSLAFLKNYAELFYLKYLTDFSNNENTFTVFNNELPHDPVQLSYPNYDLSSQTDSKYKPLINTDLEKPTIYYNVNMATYRILGDYMDYLRENGVYDNTRIIIVSDHGRSELKNPHMDRFMDKYFVNFNPILLVKDFNSNGELKISDEIMTNADVPIIATKNIINSPKNPYTHKVFSNKDKSNGIILKFDKKWQPHYYIGKEKVCSPNDSYYYVNGDPIKQKNWEINIQYNKILKIFKSKYKKY